MARTRRKLVLFSKLNSSSRGAPELDDTGQEPEEYPCAAVASSREEALEKLKTWRLLSWPRLSSRPILSPARNETRAEFEQATR